MSHCCDMVNALFETRGQIFFLNRIGCKFSGTSEKTLSDKAGFSVNEEQGDE